jgi:hypothetical protein
MNWWNRLALSATAAVALVALPASAVSQQKSLKDQLVGTWQVVSWEQVRPDGSRFQRFGTNPKGVHIFDANGRYAVIFAHPELPRIASNNPSTPTPEELKGLVGRSIAYYGTYTVDEASKVVDLRVEASSFPNQVGGDNRRTITVLTADELKYENTRPLSGGQIHIGFKRAPAAATN